MDTYFAPARRVPPSELETEIKIVSENPLVSGLLHSISGLIAVLNEHRQVVALNDSFFRMLGIEKPEKALGLRLGEALQCIHGHDEPAGCGTTKYCSSCGAALAIVSSLSQDKPVERICALSANKGGKEVDFALLVKSNPIKIDQKVFLLLFLQDITQQQQRAALERTFFHDVNNMLTILNGASEFLVDEEPSELAHTIRQATIRLMKEVAIQRCLFQNESCEYPSVWTEVTTEHVMDEIQSFFNNHPAARNKTINISRDYPVVSIKIDISLLSRVLGPRGRPL